MATYLFKQRSKRRRKRSIPSSDEHSEKTTHPFGRHLEVSTAKFPGHLATLFSFPMSSQLFPSHDNRLIVSLSSTRDKQSAREIRRTRDARIFGIPLESRVPRVLLSRVYFACPINLAEIRGYSQCWTVTLLWAFLAVTITFHNLECSCASMKRLYHAGSWKNA